MRCTDEFQKQQYTISEYLVFVIINVCFSFTAVTTVSVVLVSVLIVSVISTDIITSIIVWCVMRPHHDKPPVTTPSPPSAAGGGGGGGGGELALVIYDTPITQHTITTQHNVAYGGTIPLKHNEARLINMINHRTIHHRYQVEE